MNSAKQKVKDCVDEYRRTATVQLPDGSWRNEYDQFVEETDAIRSQQRQSDNKQARMKHGDLIKRQLGKMPEKLFWLIRAKLTTMEREWLEADGKFRGNFAGPTWFYKTYPVFRITDAI